MKIFMVDSTPESMQRLRDRWTLRRAVVIAINKQAAVNWVLKGIKGEAVFAGLDNEMRFPRLGDPPAFEPQSCQVHEMGEAHEGSKGSRVLAWELIPPEERTGLSATRRGVSRSPAQAEPEATMGLFKFLFGNDHRSRAQRDQYRPSTIGKNLISPVNAYGTCFSCEGQGRRTLKCNPCEGSGNHTRQCRICEGTGRYRRTAKPCFGCQGTGSRGGSPCRRCSGTGAFQAALDEACRKCSGAGKQIATCHNCKGTSSFEVTCRKCDGTGWHKHGKR